MNISKKVVKKKKRKGFLFRAAAWMGIMVGSLFFAMLALTVSFLGVVGVCDWWLGVEFMRIQTAPGVEPRSLYNLLVYLFCFFMLLAFAWVAGATAEKACDSFDKYYS